MILKFRCKCLRVVTISEGEFDGKSVCGHCKREFEHYDRSTRPFARCVKDRADMAEVTSDVRYIINPRGGRKK